MSIKLPHVCPNCGKVAKTKKELEEKFGFRTVEGKKIIAQSWCKKCRTK